MTALVVESKLKILAEVDKKDCSKTEICKAYGIANSTLSTFVKDREKIESESDTAAERGYQAVFATAYALIGTTDVTLTAEDMNSIDSDLNTCAVGNFRNMQHACAVLMTTSRLFNKCATQEKKQRKMTEFFSVKDWHVLLEVLDFYRAFYFNFQYD
jgi:hypothetical protein